MDEEVVVLGIIIRIRDEILIRIRIRIYLIVIVVVSFLFLFLCGKKLISFFFEMGLFGI